MIIGPREMTRNVDLQRRVFLHSYRPHLDPDGSALESIMTAPLVVAQHRSISDASALFGFDTSP